MKVIDCIQGTEEWKLARCGVPTASYFDMIVTTKGEQSKQRQKYLYKLAGEFISQTTDETYQSEAMKRGTEMEEEARKLYQIITDNAVATVGFCLSDCGSYGASPDGMVGDKGLLEIKCPMISTHVSYLLDGTLPTEYYQQVQGQLLVTGREWCDFVSYYPGLKPLLVRVARDTEFLMALHRELGSFCKELEAVIERIK